jgi:hypothetical protein
LIAISVSFQVGVEVLAAVIALAVFIPIVVRALAASAAIAVVTRVSRVEIACAALESRFRAAELASVSHALPYCTPRASGFSAN